MRLKAPQTGGPFLGISSIIALEPALRVPSLLAKDG